MSKHKKGIPVSLFIIITLVVGFVQHFGDLYQLIFLGILLIGLIYSILELNKSGGENYAINVIISAIIFIILCTCAVAGRNFTNMNDNTEGIVLAIAFVEFFSTLSLFGYRSAIKSGDRRRIRKVVIGLCLLWGSVFLLGLIVLASVLGY